MGQLLRLSLFLKSKNREIQNDTESQIEYHCCPAKETHEKYLLFFALNWSEWHSISEC